MLTDIRVKMANTFRIRCETSSMNNISALKPRRTPCESSSGRLEKYHSIKNKHTLRQLLAGTDRTKWLMARWLSILRKKNLKVYLNFYGKKMKQWKYCFRLNERNSIKFGHTKTNRKKMERVSTGCLKTKTKVFTTAHQKQENTF